MSFTRRNRRWLVPVLAGVMLRALIPAGYMPAAGGSGTLFILCPDQLPAWVSVPGADGHEHGHHGNDEPAGNDGAADSCDFAHLALTAAANDADPVVAIVPEPVAEPAALEPASADLRSPYRPSPRAPPA